MVVNSRASFYLRRRAGGGKNRQTDKINYGLARENIPVKLEI
jgi:hypothetical protein